MSRLGFLLRSGLVLALALGTQSLLFVQVAFSVNQEWIAETLCVNRDAPEEECDGQCVLRDRMVHADGHAHDPAHEHVEGHSHSHGSGDDAPVRSLELALSIRPLLAEAPRLVPPPPTVRAYGDAVVLGAASGAGADVFRPPRERAA